MRFLWCYFHSHPCKTYIPSYRAFAAHMPPGSAHITAKEDPRFCHTILTYTHPQAMALLPPIDNTQETRHKVPSHQHLAQVGAAVAAATPVAGTYNDELPLYHKPTHLVFLTHTRIHIYNRT